MGLESVFPAVTVVGMPKGLLMPVTGLRGATASGAAVSFAAVLVFSSTVSAQASHSVEEFDQPSDSSSSYPAPGQPVGGVGGSQGDPEETTVQKAGGDLRVATLNADLTDSSLEDLLDSLKGGADAEARAVAETAQLNAPDVLVVTGISYDEDEQIAETFNEQYLGRSQNGEDALDYPYVYTDETNSGLDSGADLDGDGQIGGPGDAFGYGNYTGEHSMAIFSTQPIVTDEVRTFQSFLWDDMPENGMPEDDYSDVERSIMRLACATVWDVPVETEGGEHLHLVATTKPEIGDDVEMDADRGDDQRRMLADYISGDGWYIYDDEGEEGGLHPDDDFVVVGQPANKTAELDEDLETLLKSPFLQDPEPEAVTEQPLSTRPGADDSDPLATRSVSGGPDVRASYTLPSNTVDVSGSGVFWPGRDEFGFDLVDPSEDASPENRLVWVDLAES